MKVSDILVESKIRRRSIVKRNLAFKSRFKKQSEFALYFTNGLNDVYINKMLEDFNLDHIGRDVTDNDETVKVIKHLAKHLTEKGSKVKVCEGIFETDLPDYWGMNFTDAMEQEMVDANLNPENDLDCELFVKDNYPHVDFTKMKHSWVEFLGEDVGKSYDSDKRKIIDPTVGQFTTFITSAISNKNYL